MQFRRVYADGTLRLAAFKINRSKTDTAKFHHWSALVTRKVTAKSGGVASLSYMFVTCNCVLRERSRTKVIPPVNSASSSHPIMREIGNWQLAGIRFSFST